MEAKLIKNGNAYSLKINSEYVAFANEDFVCYATQEFRDNLLGKLSLKNCQAIERGYDLDELIDKYCRGNSKIEDDFIKEGFQKTLEILGDKKFSEDDMKEAYSRGFLQQGIKSFNSLIQSLQQTEWDCIIEMECIDPNCDGINRKGECMPGKNPKIDASGCLILKRK